MQAKSERFELRLDPSVLQRIDNWRSEQDDLPTRAEAVRRLVEAGMTQAPKSEGPFSRGERLTIMMLRDIMKHLKMKGELNPDFIASAIYGGHYWGLDWQYPGLFHSHVDRPEVVRLVVDSLDMWSFIEEAYEKFSKADKSRIKSEVGILGEDVCFDGFDGNNEIEYLGVTRFLIDDLARFSRFKGRDLNSHSPRVHRYGRMLRIFEPIRATLVGHRLSATQVIEILKSDS